MKLEKALLETYERQVTLNPVYRRFCRLVHKGVVQSWHDIPAIPITAFKYNTMACFKKNQAKGKFLTSGTTRTLRGALYYQSLTEYNRSLERSFAREVLRGSRNDAVLSLIPSFKDNPVSSLSYMMTRAVRVFGLTTYWAISKKRVKMDGAIQFLNQKIREKRKVLILTTSLALLDFMEDMARKGIRLRLPAGSQLMDTGGYKGRKIKTSRKEIVARVKKLFGIPQSHVVNEYGMTELSSQFYARGTSGVYSVPPWVKIAVTDARGRILPKGKKGFLRVWDLANQDTCAFIQTEDIARIKGKGFELLGRRKSSDLRGCSLTYAELKNNHILS
jgi:acyl-CoA synthetase (AMP-forming)/AMP-acid ligase II